MTLYAVEYSGPLNDYQWSIVTIHKSLEGAENAKMEYLNNYGVKVDIPDYRIKEIIISEDSKDIVYDCEKEI